jgi:hypothetical protein
MLRDVNSKWTSTEGALAKGYSELTRRIALVTTVCQRVQSAIRCYADVIKVGFVALEILLAVHRGHDVFNLFCMFLSQLHFHSPSRPCNVQSGVWVSIQKPPYRNKPSALGSLSVVSIKNLSRDTQVGCAQIFWQSYAARFWLSQ